MSISAKELALKLGVSPSAVSIALNGKTGISDETRTNILQAAERYGLQHTRRRRANSAFFTLVIYKKHGKVCSETDFFSAVIEGITTQAAVAGYKIQLFYLYGYDNLEEKISELVVSDSAGFIFFATEMEQDDIRLLEHFDCPHVILDSYFPQYHHNYISIANVEGAYLSTRHLLERGHRRIGYLASSIRINNFCERRTGLQMALDEYPGCTLEEIFVSPTQDGAYLDMRAYLAEHAVDVTGCFADNDIIAVSCIRALKENNYLIPADVSITSFDDMPISYVTAPKLTTIHVAKEALGQRAVKRLCELLDNPDEPAMLQSIGVTLTERDSVRTL